uniref:Serine/threonine-protein kinase n=1 Tax=Rhizophora mucronata TaxID=61149 RepID=A0A2P2K8U6_RHIMU
MASLSSITAIIWIILGFTWPSNGIELETTVSEIELKPSLRVIGCR